MKNGIVIALCLVAGTHVHAQRAGFELSYANDLFAHTDRYFTQGIRLQVNNGFVRHSPIGKILPAHPNALARTHSLALCQDVFTPTSIIADTILHNDRPYAALLYLEEKRSTTTAAGWTMNAALSIGIMGPAAGGKRMQTTIHRAIDDVLPEGWKFQLQNHPMIEYELGLFKELMRSKYIQLEPGAIVHAGTVFDHASLSVNLRTGLLPDLKKERQGWLLFIEGSGTASAVLYNASLQGGFLRSDDPYNLAAKDIERLITKATVSGVAGFRNIVFRYSQTWLTREFHSGQPHAWGTIQLSVTF